MNLFKFKMFQTNVLVNASTLLLPLASLISNGLTTEWLTNLGVFFIAFASVLLHEFGHGLVGRKLGFKFDTVILHAFGGLALIGEEKDNVFKDPKKNLAITLAGPAVNFVLAVIFAFLYALMEINILAYIALINIVLGVFNLVLPLYPMDGGRVLQGVTHLILNKITGRDCYEQSLIMSLYVSVIGSIVISILAFSAGMLSTGIIVLIVGLISLTMLSNRIK